MIDGQTGIVAHMFPVAHRVGVGSVAAEVFQGILLKFAGQHGERGMGW